MRALVTNINPQPGDNIQGTVFIDSPNLSLQPYAIYDHEGQHYRTIAIRASTDNRADFEVDVERDKSFE